MINVMSYNYLHGTTSYLLNSAYAMHTLGLRGALTLVGHTVPYPANPSEVPEYHKKIDIVSMLVVLYVQDIIKRSPSYIKPFTSIARNDTQGCDRSRQCLSHLSRVMILKEGIYRRSFISSIQYRI